MAVPHRATVCPQCGCLLDDRSDLGPKLAGRIAMGFGMASLLLAANAGTQGEWASASICGVVGLGLLALGLWLVSRIRT